ncbi:hypothetical protein VCR3J2_230108 [Vibrio coralliirubri]|nr:hypothetical protein VCR3J2_230108 [Vibrio coralliirubri]
MTDETHPNTNKYERMRPENMLIAKTSWNSRSKLDKERKRKDIARRLPDT